ncbi:MAG: tetratricopeptide repeat protein [Magnetococcales bacterium]|nr:tetratricopeptide repeat protein [Magnetococcales bacterium]
MHFYSERTRLESLEAQELLLDAWEVAKGLLQKCLSAGEQAYEGADYDLALSFFDFGRYSNKIGYVDHALPLLQEARRRFQLLISGEKLDSCQMAAIAIHNMGDSLLQLGRLDEAAQCFQRSIQEKEIWGDQRGIAVSQFQLGTVCLYQEQYQEALIAFEKSREIFSRLNEPATVAVSWHQTGRVFEQMKAWFQAEDAYRYSLEIATKLNNLVGVSTTLLQLGNLFEAQSRWEESVVQYRKAASIYVQMGNLAKEGMVRSNLAAVLLQLNRLAEARQEILRAIGCKKDFGYMPEPWKTLDVLADIETADNQPQAAAQARRQARQLFASYRRGGGENYETGAKWCQATEEFIQQGQIDEAKQAFEQIANDPEIHPYTTALIATLLDILDGQRQPELAEREDLYYQHSVEIELLLERLAQ